MSDLSQFHYYDQKPEFSAEISVSGTARISVKAATKEEARGKFEAMLDEAFRNDSIIDLLELDDVDDADINYISAHPTRMYLLTRPGGRGETGSSHVQPGDLPRAPTKRDQEMADSFGCTVSWKPEDVLPEGGAK